MKKLTLLILCCLSGIFVGCIKMSEKANVNDLQITDGISNHKLMLDGAIGVKSTFSFIANHDWQIIDYHGFECNPSSGCKSSNPNTITVTTLVANNSADTIRLSDLNFKLLDTRFVGISAYQTPQLRLKEGGNATLNAVAGSETTATIITQAEIIELRTKGDIEARLGKKNSRNEYVVTIKALSSNESSSTLHVGTVEFLIDGVKQESVISVSQLSAIVFDRSQILLPGHTGGWTIFEVHSDFDIDFTCSSDLFTVSAVENQPQTFKVVASTDNDSDAELSLGNIEFFLKDEPSCRATIEVRQRKVGVAQTIIVHFIGTYLQTYFNENLKRILETLDRNIQGDSRVIAITTDATTDATLYELRYDSSIGKAVKEKIMELPLSIPYNSTLFETNLREAISFAPAEKYALIIGSHGLGWVPKNLSSSSSRTLLRMGISPETLWERNKNAEMTRHLGDSPTTRYDVVELASAIEANNIKFEYILFDACFMGNVESVYELRNATKYIIGSPCEIMGYGFPYAKVMPYMLMNNGTEYDLDKICKEYVDYYKSEATTHSACVALTNTAELEALAAAMKEVNKAGIKENFSLKNVQYYEGQATHSFYDLGDMVEQSCADSAAATAFKTQLDKTVTSRYHTDQFYSAYGSGNKYYHDINYYSGITTSAMVEHYVVDWQKTAWYNATH